jgi:hypothetical protein
VFSILEKYIQAPKLIIFRIIEDISPRFLAEIALTEDFQIFLSKQ